MPKKPEARSATKPEKAPALEGWSRIEELATGECKVSAGVALTANANFQSASINIGGAVNCEASNAEEVSQLLLAKSAAQIEENFPLLQGYLEQLAQNKRDLES